LIEPFVGAGSIFLAANYPEYVLNDANSDLAAVWVALKSRPNEFIARAEAYFTNDYHSQNGYLKIRAEFNSEVDRFERAVRLPYLNKFGFNGIYRVSQRGVFNVPYANPKTLPAFPWKEMQAASDKLQACMVLNGGFQCAISLAGIGDVVYCDPPYLDSATGKSFTSYTSTSFGLQQHLELVKTCLQAVDRGATVLISNHSTSQTRELYRGWDIDEFLVTRSVSAKRGSRGQTMELVAKLPKWFDAA